MNRLDKHSFWLKVAALTAKSLCVLPILNWVMAIYVMMPDSGVVPADFTVMSLAFYLVCLPAMVWGFFLYYYDVLLNKKRRNSTPAKVILSFLLFVLLSALNVLLLWVIWRNVVVFGLAFIGMFLFAYWGYAASIKSYSEVLSTKQMIVIGVIYLVYLLVIMFMWVANARSMVVNFEPIIFGIVVFGALAFIVMNQAAVDYEMQNRDAESTDARRNIQKFNFRVSLILVGALGVLYFTRDLISSFLTWILLVIRDGISFVSTAVRGIEKIEFQGESKGPNSYVSSGVSEVQHDVLFESRESVFFIALLIIIALLIVFRKPIMKALRKSIKFLARFLKIKTYSMRGTSQYYRDLVEEIDEEEARRMFASDARKKRNRKAMIKEYDKLTDPTERVRRALPVLRHLFSEERPAFRDGDTTRQTVNKIDAKSTQLAAYASVYEGVRYNDQVATVAEGEQAVALVHQSYDQAKAESSASAKKKK